MTLHYFETPKQQIQRLSRLLHRAAEEAGADEMLQIESAALRAMADHPDHFFAWFESGRYDCDHDEPPQFCIVGQERVTFQRCTPWPTYGVEGCNENEAGALYLLGYYT